MARRRASHSVRRQRTRALGRRGPWQRRDFSPTSRTVPSATLENMRPGAAIGNPLILGHDAAAEDYAAAWRRCAMTPTWPPRSSSTRLRRAPRDRRWRTPLHAWREPACTCRRAGSSALDEGTRPILAGANVALFDMPEKAARAFVHLDRYRRSQEALQQSRFRGGRSSRGRPQIGPRPGGPGTCSADDRRAGRHRVSDPHSRIWRAINANRATLDDEESIFLLRAWGFRVPQRPIATLDPSRPRSPSPMIPLLDA